MAVKRVTMQDIADACGLSRNTVSKVFNGRGSVPEATKRLIFYRTVYPALYFFTRLFTRTNCPWRAISFLVSLCHNHYST